MSVPTENSRVVLNKRPDRGPLTPDVFREESGPIPELKDGEVLVRVEWVSVDPAMRGWLNDTRSYVPPVQIGATMRAGGIGRVVKSLFEGLEEGDLVQGTLGWTEYYVGPGKTLEKREIPAGGKDIDHLGIFGMSGLTAYVGMFDIGRLKDGDNVVVSGAAGSVGLIATQIALAQPNCKVTAIAGTPEKCADLKNLGCHHVLNYKDADFKKKFKEVGLVDMFFDNVGGEILDMVLAQLNVHARIVLCGAISGYNATEPYALKNAMALIPMKSRMEGFIVFDSIHLPRFPEGRAYLADMKDKGKLQYEYTLVEPKEGESGLSRCPEALGMLFEGKNKGKTLVRIARNGNKSRM